MTKVYAVYMNGYKDCPFCEKTHYVDVLRGVFDSEEKAVKCILDFIKEDHEFIKELNRNKENITHHAIAVDEDMIGEGCQIFSSFSVNGSSYDETYYLYKSYDVK